MRSPSARASTLDCEANLSCDDLAIIQAIAAGTQCGLTRREKAASRRTSQGRLYQKMDGSRTPIPKYRPLSIGVTVSIMI
jgi:hypothetical protein